MMHGDNLSSENNNIWFGDNIKNMSPEEIEESFFGLDYSNEMSVQKFPQNSIELGRKEAITPDFDLTGFDENITKEDILAEGSKHTKPTKQVKHTAMLNHLLEEIPIVDFEENAGVKGKDQKLTLSTVQVLIIDCLINTAQINGWNLCKNNYQIHLYNGAYWSLVGRELFEAFLGDIAAKMGIPKLTTKYYVFREKLFKQFMAVAFFDRPAQSYKKVLINFLNGTFEISQGKQKLRPPCPDDFLCYQLPFAYDPSATAPVFEEYLNYALPQDDKRVQNVLSEFMGSVFINELKLEKALLLTGLGANGKSVFFEVMYHLYGGSENVSSFSIYSLTDNTGAYRAAFAYKLLNYASEISSKMNNSVFKALVSGEPVEARFLYGQPFMLPHYGKLAFNCNELPKDVEFTHAFFRRFLIIPFEQTVPEDKQDKELANKIIATELPGVFNWVIAGLNRLLIQRKFTYSAAVEGALETYKKQSDNVRLFIEEEGYTRSLTHSIPLKEAYDAYKIFCQQCGYRSGSIKTFSERLRAMNFEIVRKNKGNYVFIANDFVSTIGI